MRELSINVPSSYNERTMLEQELAYYESLYNDILKEINRQRQIDRTQLITRLSTKLPNVIENTLTPQEQRLLRSARFGRLSDREQQQISLINNKLNRLREGGCYNLSELNEQQLRTNERLFSLIIPGLPYTFCYDILDILKNGLINEDLGLADVYINLPDGERYRYPLTNDETETLIGSIRLAGYDPESFPRLEFPNLAEARRNAFALRIRLKQFR